MAWYKPLPLKPKRHLVQYSHRPICVHAALSLTAALMIKRKMCRCGFLAVCDDGHLGQCLSHDRVALSIFSLASIFGAPYHSSCLLRLHSSPQQRLLVMNKNIVPVLRYDDVVEMTRHFVNALVTVGPVPYAEGLLHAGLLRPIVERVARPDVTRAATG